MTDALPLIIAAALPIVALVVGGRRRGEPAWVIGGNIAGYLFLAAGIVWASRIGSEALWAAFVAAFGVAVWAQIEFLWWRRRGGR